MHKVLPGIAMSVLTSTHMPLLCMHKSDASFLQTNWGSESTTSSESNLPSGDASDGYEGATDDEADGVDEEQQHRAKLGRRSRQQQGEGQQRWKRRAVGPGPSSAPVPAFELPGQAGVNRQSGRSRQLPARLR
jgi:hypothetical protein